ncbi:hypothetical protein BJV74DRAFT_763443 [Russula compacta]|nr:hypothetical protein BJV74DRAFT_763443 [Russula compacta]
MTQDASKKHGAFPRARERSYTEVKPSQKIRKIIIVCCDGTWNDGVVISERWKYTNVLRLSRAIHHVDVRLVPPVPQIVFYQSGVGTEPDRFEAILDGATGASLGTDKVQEAYTFIAHNYEPGDEIFLFGFSRGAYTARMVAMVISEIGILDRTELDHFAGIFITLQARGKSQDKHQIELLDAKLAPWTKHNLPSKAKADCDGESFGIKCIGVFDTVGSLGLPEELAFGPKKIRTPFGLPDSLIVDQIERAYQALALNETRADFECIKFQLTEEGRKKGQILKQCWFAGSHSDIGGGYKEHDLSDIALFWMVANIEDMVSIDTEYVLSLSEPNAPWGTQRPHNSRTGIFVLADTIHRQFPTSFNPTTHESIHPSVLTQSAMLPQLRDTLATHPDLIYPLMPLEQQAKQRWPFASCEHSRESATDVMESESGTVVGNEAIAFRHQSFIARAVSSLKRRARSNGPIQSN